MVTVWRRADDGAVKPGSWNRCSEGACPRYDRISDVDEADLSQSGASPLATGSYSDQGSSCLTDLGDNRKPRKLRFTLFK